MNQFCINSETSKENLGNSLFRYKNFGNVS